MPLVSVVIPCFNGAVTIERCLRSCVEQDYRNLEIIVVDNNSSDDSCRRIQRFANESSRPITLLNNTEQGVNMTRHVGLMAAKGEYIQLLDADDTLSAEKISRQVQVLEANKDCAFAYGDWYWRFERESPPREPDVLIRSQQYDDMLLQLLIDNWRPPHCYLARRSALVSIPALARLARHTHIATDREYITLAAILGMKFRYVPESSVRYYTWSSTQITRAAGPSARARSLLRIFRRLQGYSLRSPTITQSEIHRRLLKQDLHLWQTSADLKSDALEQVGVVQKAIFVVLQTAGEAFTFERGAKLVAHHLMSRQLAAVLAAGRVPDLVAVQRSLSRWLMSDEQPILHVSIPDPVIEASTERLWGFHIGGPSFAPKYAEQRWLIFQHLQRMAAGGLLVPE